MQTGRDGAMKKYAYVKNVLDFLFAAVLLVPLAPVLLLLSLLIRLDSKGPVLFRQERLGKNGKVFEIYKFRTMVEDAIHQGTGLRTNDDDPRITRMGGLLRRTSLDELPQLLNILKGEMSFVGPRPPVPYHPRPYGEYTAADRIRFTVRPGISGLAQVLLRNSATWDQRFVVDAEYVQKMSLLLDIRIVLKTLGVVARNENIYLSEEAKAKVADVIPAGDEKRSEE